MTLTLQPVLHIPLIQPGDDLAEILDQSLKATDIVLADGDVLVVAQKIISKVEGRLVNLKDVIPTQRANDLVDATGKDPRLLELILRESNEVLRTRLGTIIVEHRKGFVCANAGIDHSNVQGPGGIAGDWVLLLPDDSDASAERLRLEMERRSRVNLGVLIIDSHGRAWRNGVVGTAIGLSNVPGIVDMRGMPDLFGYQLQVTTIAAADELAAAASLVMGQADESTPVVHVRGFPYSLRDGHLTELIRDREKDLFR